MGVCCKGWWRLIELQSFLLSKVDVDPIHRIFDVFSTLSACFVQDAVLPSRSCQDPCVLCPWDPQAERILSVCCSNFGLPVSILNSWWSVNWLHIRCDKCTRRNRWVLIHRRVMKDQWDCVLNDLEELGGKGILVLLDQYMWNLFFTPPPPAMLLFHLSSDQWWQYKKCFWRLSSNLQNSIAPSSSQGRLPWRRRLLSCFDTG